MNKSLNNDGAFSAIVVRFLAIRSENLSKASGEYLRFCIKRITENFIIDKNLSYNTLK